MFFKLSALIFCLLLHLSPARAEAEFKPLSWSPGLHLLAAGGFNSSLYSSSTYKQNVGLGLNFRTDLGYYFTHKWAFELSSTVKFNRLQEFLVWDTLFTLGVRYRFDTRYLRLFYGRAPTVFYTSKTQFQTSKRSVSRLQYDGPVMGFSVGNMYRSLGKTWFVDLAMTLQYLETEEAITMRGEVPVVLSTSHPSRTTIYSVLASIGVLVF